MSTLQKICNRLLSSSWFILINHMCIIGIILISGAGTDSWSVIIEKAHEGKLDILMVLIGLIYSGTFTMSTEFSYSNVNFNNLFELILKHTIVTIYNLGTGTMTLFIFMYLRVILGSEMPILLISVSLLYFAIILYQIHDFNKAKQNHIDNFDVKS